VGDELNDLMAELECSVMPVSQPLLINDGLQTIDDSGDLKLEELFKKYFEDLAAR
jgi:hypothetical protein